MSDPLTDIHEGASLSVELRIDAVCRRFEAAWKAGEQPRPEDFLTGWEGAERLILLRELNLIDADYRRRAGETPSFKSYSHESTPNSGVETPVDDPLPRLFGRYTLRSMLGRGGMGRVYLAHDPQLDRLVALKMPNPVEGVMGWRDRFLTEARAAATLTHPHVCPVHDVGEVDGQPYLTMAYIEGETLATKLAREGTFAPAAAAELVRAVARAMHEAHRRGIVHRDLKPANLMLDSASRPVVMDFGLAIRSTATDDLRLTLTGVALGTPAYMPPEQAGGDHESVGPSSDVYSLGVVLFEMLTGRPPFTAKSFGKLLAKIERDLPPAPSSLNPNVDQALEAIILTALAKSPADRFASAGELADALDKYLEGDLDQLISLYSKPYLIPDATSEYRPGPATAPTAEFPKRRKRAGWLAGAAALLMAAVAGAIIYVETDYGQLVVQLPDPNAKVEVRVNGQEVTLDASGGKAIRVRAGANHKLEVTGADFETVADTYDVKRNGVTLARVTLVPKGGVAKVIPPDPKPDDTSKKDPPKPDPVVVGPPKPVEFPKQSTLTEVPGWQILTDATKDEMQKWLDERKKDKHSVMWLDVMQVANKPLFSAAAALDNRAPDWQAFLDVECPLEKKVPEMFSRVLDINKNRPHSISAYQVNNIDRVAALWVPGVSAGVSGYLIGTNNPSWDLENLLRSITKNGFKLRVIRPYLIEKGVVVYALRFERNNPGEKNSYVFEMTSPRLAEYLQKCRVEGLFPTSLAAAPQDSEPLFSVAMAENVTKAAWEVDTNLTSQTFGHKAKDMVTRGFAPTCVTSYPWDGAVRYCVVWVKEPPKPVEYPKGPTLIEVPGWQILTDATKEQMQKWLDERKRDKHSVTWLDVMQVANKPLFSAAAALDNRAPDWQAFLALQGSKEKTVLEVFDEVIDHNTHRLISISGYQENGAPHAATLWVPGDSVHWFGIQQEPYVHKKQLAAISKNGMKLRTLRPYLIDKDVVQYAYYLERHPDERNAYSSEMTAPKLAEFLEKHRTEGFLPTSVAAVPQDGELVFAATMADNPTKTTWEVDTNLTSQTLDRKARDMVTRGFAPTCVTSYPLDGAVRYCVVWVKEPPKPVEFPKGPTLIEPPGWQILTNATKEQMQKWLDERKKDKHSVMWLDAIQVQDKPVFSAVAALDNREPGWKVIFDAPAGALTAARLRNSIDTQANYVVAASGYELNKESLAVLLWWPDSKRFALVGDDSTFSLKKNLPEMALQGYTARLLRPNLASDGTTRWIAYIEIDTKKTQYALELSAEKLATFIDESKGKGLMPTSIAASLRDDSPSFTVVVGLSPPKWEWQTDTTLTPEQLKAKAASLGTKGFRPSCVTAYPFDGAVRYCVVWVKDTPKGKEPTKNP